MAISIFCWSFVSNRKAHESNPVIIMKLSFPIRNRVKYKEMH